MRGFTLLEVVVALAIMAGVILTVLGSLNYHLDSIAAERDTTTLTLLARNRLVELEQQGGLQKKSEGTFAPAPCGRNLAIRAVSRQDTCLAETGGDGSAHGRQAGGGACALRPQIRASRSSRC